MQSHSCNFNMMVVQTARNLSQLIQLPGSAVLPKVATSLSKTRSQKTRKEERVSINNERDVMTEEERQCFQATASHLTHHSHSEPGNLRKKYPHTHSPYFLTNARLKKVRQSNKRIGEDHPAIRSKFLENYFIINRNELEVSMRLSLLD